METDLFAALARLLALTHYITVLARARRQHAFVVPMIVHILSHVCRLFAAIEQSLQDTK
jgi:hypothetical protein